MHPHQPFTTSESLKGEAQSLHNSEGEEVGTAQVFPTMKPRGKFPEPGLLEGGGVVLTLGIYEKRTSTSPVATSGPPQVSTVPAAEGLGQWWPPPGDCHQRVSKRYMPYHAGHPPGLHPRLQGRLSC